MPNKHGDFIWYELMTSDATAAEDFYGSLVGWTFGDPDMDAKNYQEFGIDGEAVGGLMPLTSEMTSGGAKPAWLGYINVDDVDDTAKSIMSAGGEVLLEPQDIPGVGRFAYVADPQGAMFYVMKPTPLADNPDYESTSFAKTDPKAGHCAWNELMTSDPESALAFYGDLFGWTKADELDMGPMGTYHLLDHGYGLGGVMKKADEMPMSAWTFYFRVPDIDMAVETVKAKGGQTMMDPMEIPGGDFTTSGIDPQGAFFSIIGERNS